MEENKAYQKSLRLLNRKPYSEFKLRQKLLLAGHQSENIDEAITRVKELNYLNDKEYAHARIRGLARKNYSASYIQIKLQNEERINISLEEIREQFEVIGLSETIQKENLAAKYQNEEDHAKLLRRLAAKGHDHYT